MNNLILRYFQQLLLCFHFDCFELGFVYFDNLTYLFTLNVIQTFSLFILLQFFLVIDIYVEVHSHCSTNRICQLLKSKESAQNNHLLHFLHQRLIYVLCIRVVITLKELECEGIDHFIVLGRSDGFDYFYCGGVVVVNLQELSHDFERSCRFGDIFRNRVRLVMIVAEILYPKLQYLWVVADQSNLPFFSCYLEFDLLAHLHYLNCYDYLQQSSSYKICLLLLKTSLAIILSNLQ